MDAWGRSRLFGGLVEVSGMEETFESIVAEHVFKTWEIPEQRAMYHQRGFVSPRGVIASIFEPQPGTSCHFVAAGAGRAESACGRAAQHGNQFEGWSEADAPHAPPHAPLGRGAPDAFESPTPTRAIAPRNPLVARAGPPNRHPVEAPKRVRQGNPDAGPDHQRLPEASPEAEAEPAPPPGTMPQGSPVQVGVQP